jgi:gluconolactonase
MKFYIEKHNSILDEIIHPETCLTKIQGGFRFLEGPVWHPIDQSLIFSDIMGNALYCLKENDRELTQTISMIRENSHLANGNTYDRDGKLLTCEHGTSRVTRLERDGTLSVVASHYRGKELNSPNDIIVSRNGMIYFTDPASGRTDRYGIPRKQELNFQGVYSIDSFGNLKLLVDDFAKPNGLCLSLDEKKLFINDTDHQHIRVFDLTETGTLKNGNLWADLHGVEPGVADGMKLDAKSNLYCSGPGGIHIFDSYGEFLGRIMTPEVAANFGWGGHDFTTMYLTATTSLYKIKLNIPGLPLFDTRVSAISDRIT